ncbi:MAG: ATP-binding protein [Chloroflexi bacterium]|nr:ATP-binding protein [Chloroflexota bacterium]
MENKNTKEGSWNAGRVLSALGRIGYHPVSALLDIADNSVSANASKVSISIETTRGKGGKRGKSRAVISSFSVYDNGLGMNEEGIHNAFTLGSSTKYYVEGTLSKFGMGLKSAAFSLGNRLEIISRVSSESSILKASLDLKTINKSQGKYIYEISTPTENDIRQFETVCGNGSGTIIRITEIHTEAMLKPSEIIEGIKK